MFAVPALTLKTGYPRVTEIFANWLSKVTMRGVETTCALCGEKCEAAKAHAHHGWTIGDECCWDDRLRSVE